MSRRPAEEESFVRVAVVGSYGVGITMRVPRIPVAGETLPGATFASGHGGKGSNQAVQARRLGADVSFLTAIGDDPMGQAARDLWADEGVDASSVVTAPAATMAGVILVEPTGENRIVIATGALDHLTPDHVDAFAERMAEADVAVVSMEIPLATVVVALRVAHDVGTTTLLNPAPAQRLPDSAWPYVDVLTPNRTEAAILLGHDPDGPESAEDLAQALRDRSGATVVLTRGGDGALICDEHGLTDVPAVRVPEVLDTTGAGDAFTAALSVELAAGRKVADAAAFAARVGAHVVARHEVIPALPRRADLDPLEG
jgi:ribokinase